MSAKAPQKHASAAFEPVKNMIRSCQKAGSKRGRRRTEVGLRCGVALLNSAPPRASAIAGSRARCKPFGERGRAGMQVEFADHLLPARIPELFRQRPVGVQ